MKLQELKSGQCFINLPRSIIKAKQWKKGDEIKVRINDKGDLVLSK